MYQVIFGLTIGQTYDFSYYYGGRGNNDEEDVIVRAAINTIDLGLAGDLYNAKHVTNNPIGVWNLAGGSFIANAASAYLFFEEVSNNSEGRGVAIDTASISAATAAVPTPATLALFGLGLAGLGYSRRKKA